MIAIIWRMALHRNFVLWEFIVSVLSPQPVGYILASNLFSVLILNLALLNSCGQWNRRSRCVLFDPKNGLLSPQSLSASM